MRISVKMIIASFSNEDADTMRAALLDDVRVANLRMTNNVKVDGKKANVLSFDVLNMIFFPAILDNVRANKERMRLTVSAYIGNKKFDLDKIK